MDAIPRKDKEEDAQSVNSEKVLIEKEGVFELVSASEVEANSLIATNNSRVAEEKSATKLTTVQDYQEQKIMSNVVNKELKTPAQQPSTMDDTDGVEKSGCSQTSDDKTVSLKQDGRQATTQASLTRDQTTDRGTKQITEQHQTKHEKLNSKSVIISPLISQSSTKSPISKSTRTASAPASRPTLQTSTDKERQQLNEQAFQSWLEKKNKELAEKLKQEQAKQRKLEAEILERKQVNERAFNCWYAAKQKQLKTSQIENMGRSLTKSETEEDKKMASRAYQKWLSQKQMQKVREKKLSERKDNKIEHAARKVDPEIAKNAYKQWLRQKTTEAREESIQKDKCRKLFFKETRQLKESLSLRFEGF